MMSRCLSMLSAVLMAAALSCSGGEPAGEADAGGVAEAGLASPASTSSTAGICRSAIPDASR